MRRYSFGEMLDGKFLPSVGALLAGKYESNEAPLRIDFSIRAEFAADGFLRATCCAAMPLALAKVKDKKVIIGATAIELGDRFSVPNGRRHLRPAAADAGRRIDPARPRAAQRSKVVTLGGLALIALLMLLMWRRASALARVAVLVGLAALAEVGAMLLQAKLAIILDTSLWHMAIAAYLAAMALDEIDFRSLLGGIAERRFQRIAMSLGDGLVCADQNGLITVWNPGAVAIFGYRAEEMIGQPLDRIRAGTDGEGPRVPFSILASMADSLNVPGGKVMELEGRRKNGEVVSARGLLLRLAGRRWPAIWRGDARHLRAQARGEEDPSTWPSTTR